MKCYLILHTESVIGFVYDLDRFVENGWLESADDSDKKELDAQGIPYTENTEYGTKYLIFSSSENDTNYDPGDKILKAGKDGKFGMYDDVQLKTEEEFDLMLLDITMGNQKAKTVMYNGVTETILTANGT